ncbi:hypothetical protein CDN99_09040 [Roseateles aquatilis]|uniref:DUF1697 domain-containing protein n=1 Tax=Roseateles aquatilis TaxID=431061 RepID=A0A246JGA8_9BURK|nr:DUF1697 domain-containing protein [Roseateles aquatilis]OWQ91603.1 hypothetical protein CDN99_09040 [Roseateles aquatilis]
MTSTHRYVAFLRGVSPMNAKMPDLIRAFEAAGFTKVKTVISSGNVVFDHPGAPVDELERLAEQAMTDTLGKSFGTTVRPVEHLRAIVDAEPFEVFSPPDNAKRLITFLKRPHEQPVTLPIEGDGAAIVKLDGVEVLSYYVPNDSGPLFMAKLEKTFGKAITTRTVDTVRKCIKA